MTTHKVYDILSFITWRQLQDLRNIIFKLICSIIIKGFVVFDVLIKIFFVGKDSMS